MSNTVLEPTLAAPTAASFELQPLAGKLGAEVRGLRLSGELAPATFAALKQALLRHKVLFFKGQQHLDDASHQAFGRTCCQQTSEFAWSRMATSPGLLAWAEAGSAAPGQDSAGRPGSGPARHR